MHIDYGKDHWNDVVNIEDFEYPTPPIYGKKYKHQFGIQEDMINTDRNIHVQEMYEEDKRIESLEQEMIDFRGSISICDSLIIQNFSTEPSCRAVMSLSNYVYLFTFLSVPLG